MDINIRRTSLDRVSRIPKQVTPEWYWTELNGKPYCDVDGTSRREQLLRTKFPRSFGWPCSVRVRWLQPDEIINKLFHEAFSRNWQFRETLTYRQLSAKCWQRFSRFRARVTQTNQLTRRTRVMFDVLVYWLAAGHTRRFRLSHPAGFKRCVTHAVSVTNHAPFDANANFSIMAGSERSNEEKPASSEENKREVYFREADRWREIYEVPQMRREKRAFSAKSISTFYNYIRELTRRQSAIAIGSSFDRTSNGKSRSLLLVNCSLALLPAGSLLFHNPIKVRETVYDNTVNFLGVS